MQLLSCIPRIKNLMDKALVLDNRAPVKSMKEQKVKLFFMEAQKWCVKNMIGYSSFNKYCITARTVHPDIVTALHRKLSENTEHIDTISTLSTLTKKVIVALLPDEETFNKSEEEIIETHIQHITGPNASLNYRRQELENNALA